MFAIEGLPEYKVLSYLTDWGPPQINLEIKLTPEQYNYIRSSCTIELPSSIVIISDGACRLEVKTNNKLAKLVKLIVDKGEYIGQFVVGFTQLSYIGSDY